MCFQRISRLPGPSGLHIAFFLLRYSRRVLLFLQGFRAVLPLPIITPLSSDTHLRSHRPLGVGEKKRARKDDGCLLAARPHARLAHCKDNDIRVNRADHAIITCPTALTSTFAFCASTRIDHTTPTVLACSTCERPSRISDLRLVAPLIAILASRRTTHTSLGSTRTCRCCQTYQIRHGFTASHANTSRQSTTSSRRHTSYHAVSFLHLTRHFSVQRKLEYQHPFDQFWKTPETCSPTQSNDWPDVSNRQRCRGGQWWWSAANPHES